MSKGPAPHLGPDRHARRQILLATILSWCLVATIVGCPARAQSREALPVETAVASTATINPLLRLSGTLEPVWQAALAGTQGGRLREVHGEPGDRLASGALAWALDEEETRLALATAEAAARVAEAALQEVRAGVRREEIERLAALHGEAESYLAQIRAEKSRLSRLFEQDLVSAAKWDEITYREKMAERQVAAAAAAWQAARAGPTPERLAVVQAQLDQARAQVAQARRRLEESRVHVPREARVTARLRHPGETVAPGEPVLRLVALDPIKVRFHVGESQVEQLRVPGPVQVQIPAGAPPVPGTLTAIIPLCDPTTRRVPCEALLANPDGRFLPGQSAEVALALPALTGLLLPRSALVERDGRTQVFVVEAGRARACPVRVLTHLDGASLVEGLADGAVVVTRGAFGLQDGAAIQVAPAPPAPAAR
ncbi:MAG: HlyD family secretion protein [Candidatus Ozemobacter sibiricus]|uniref:HlyD family secretion protein n=1 Tax=Candidatus Ozemobacter sibiricus TaxID=2268124 RepID=A0A367ZKH2_9BACT|nr:MAG: HlyD family secretion protein [Candidatus Ozemobacter sibiricus]